MSGNVTGGFDYVVEISNARFIRWIESAVAVRFGLNPEAPESRFMVSPGGSGGISTAATWRLGSNPTINASVLNSDGRLDLTVTWRFRLTLPRPNTLPYQPPFNLAGNLLLRFHWAQAGLEPRVVPGTPPTTMTRFAIALNWPTSWPSEVLQALPGPESQAVMTANGIDLAPYVGALGQRLQALIGARIEIADFPTTSSLPTIAFQTTADGSVFPVINTQVAVLRAYPTTHSIAVLGMTPFSFLPFPAGLSPRRTTIDTYVPRLTPSDAFVLTLDLRFLLFLLGRGLETAFMLPPGSLQPNADGTRLSLNTVPGLPGGAGTFVQGSLGGSTVDFPRMDVGLRWRSFEQFLEVDVEFQNFTVLNPGSPIPFGFAGGSLKISVRQQIDAAGNPVLRLAAYDQHVGFSFHVFWLLLARLTGPLGLAVGALVAQAIGLLLGGVLQGLQYLVGLAIADFGIAPARVSESIAALTVPFPFVIPPALQAALDPVRIHQFLLDDFHVHAVSTAESPTTVVVPADGSITGNATLSFGGAGAAPDMDLVWSRSVVHLVPRLAHIASLGCTEATLPHISMLPFAKQPVALSEADPTQRIAVLTTDGDVVSVEARWVADGTLSVKTKRLESGRSHWHLSLWRESVGGEGDSLAMDYGASLEATREPGTEHVWDARESAGACVVESFGTTCRIRRQQPSGRPIQVTVTFLDESGTRRRVSGQVA